MNPAETIQNSKDALHSPTHDTPQNSLYISHMISEAFLPRSRTDSSIVTSLHLYLSSKRVSAVS